MNISKVFNVLSVAGHTDLQFASTVCLSRGGGRSLLLFFGEQPVRQYCFFVTWWWPVTVVVWGAMSPTRVQRGWNQCPKAASRSAGQAWGRRVCLHLHQSTPHWPILRAATEADENFICCDISQSDGPLLFKHVPLARSSHSQLKMPVSGTTTTSNKIPLFTNRF